MGARPWISFPTQEKKKWGGGRIFEKNMYTAKQFLVASCQLYQETFP